LSCKVSPRRICHIGAIRQAENSVDAGGNREKPCSAISQPLEVVSSFWWRLVQY
jgi:hypothetical protein